MASALLLLHRARLSTSSPDAAFAIDDQSEERAYATLTSVSKMVLDSCENMAENLAEKEVASLSPLAMNSLFEAALVVLGHRDNESQTAKELDLLKSSLKYFGQRWKLGMVYLSKIEERMDALGNRNPVFL